MNGGQLVCVEPPHRYDQLVRVFGVGRLCCYVGTCL
jgi:hypothetical protein